MIKEIKKNRVFEDFKRIVDDASMYNLYVTYNPKFYIYIDHIKCHAPHSPLEDNEIIDFVNSTYNINNYTVVIVDKKFESREYLRNLLL